MLAQPERKERMAEVVKMKLTKRPKSNGGVKYEGVHTATGDEINVYIPQGLLAVVSGGKQFPEEILLSITQA